jgi:hypothetical protein
MDGALLASITIAEHKARAAVKYRRPTRAFEDAVQKSDYKFILSLDDVIASRGGIPLIEDGKIIGARSVLAGPHHFHRSREPILRCPAIAVASSARRLPLSHSAVRLGKVSRSRACHPQTLPVSF